MKNTTYVALIVSLVAITMTFALAVAPATAQTKPLQTGDYNVNGTNPDGSSYNGTVNIRREGDNYFLVWNVKDQPFYGKGTLSGDRLNINWGETEGQPTDLVTYQVLDNSILKGTWANGAGKETLAPK